MTASTYEQQSRKLTGSVCSIGVSRESAVPAETDRTNGGTILDLQQSSEQYTNSLEDFRRCRVFGMRVTESPVDTFHLISEHHESVWHCHLKRITLNFGSHCAGQQKTGFGIVRRGGKNKSRPLSSLLMSNCRIEVNPDYVSRVWNPIFYQISFPTGPSFQVSPWMFS